LEDLRTQRRDRLMVAALLAAGLALRVFFIAHGVSQDDDSDVYQELARNWFHHGVYGFSGDTGIDPTLIRLPGYPLFLGIVFSIFGDGHMRTVELLQALLDLCECWLIFDTARREVSQHAGWVALTLAMLCPFTAGYAASGMTESLSIGCVALAIWSTARLLRAVRANQSTVLPMAGLVVALACAILLRPDGVLLPAAFCTGLFWYAKGQAGAARALRLAVLAGVLAVLPLVPWTIRNYRVFHVVQPLAPRNANNPVEFVPNGFHRWMRTWSIEFVNTGTVAWNMGTDPIGLDVIPARACDPGPECTEMAAVIAAYNVHNAITPELDARFGALADEHIRRHPLEYYVEMPVLRVLDMWLRPRTELFDIDVFWWRIHEHPLGSGIAIGLAAVNLGYLVLSVIGFTTHRVPLAIPLLLYVLLRCILLGTLESPEQRYTMEAFPILFLGGGCALAGSGEGRRRRAILRSNTEPG
jgi:hypothetical protein